MTIKLRNYKFANTIKINIGNEYWNLIKTLPHYSDIALTAVATVRSEFHNIFRVFPIQAAAREESCMFMSQTKIASRANAISREKPYRAKM